MEKKKTKRNILTICIAAALLIVCATGVLVWMNTGARLANKQLSLGEKYLGEQSYEEAVLAFEKVIEINPENTDAYLRLADVHKGLGDTDAAIEILQAGLEAIPASEEIRARLANEQISVGIKKSAEGAYGDAIAAYASAIESEPENAEAYLAMADAYIADGDMDKAITSLNDVIVIVPETEEAYIKLADIYDHESDIESALAALESGYASTNSEKVKEKIDAFKAYNTRGNTVGNIFNGGCFAQQGEWIFYHNFADGGKLYKMRTDNTDHTKLNDDQSYDINVIGNWVYYSVYIDGLFNIYKIKTDGSERTMVSNERIFGSNNAWSNLCMTVIGNWIYYCDSFSGIFKIRTDGSEQTQLYNGQPCYSLSVVDDWIYFGGYQGFCKISKDGLEQTVLDVTGGNIGVAGDWLYYCFDYGEGMQIAYEIYKVRTDGTDTTKITKFNSEYGAYINVTEDWIYFMNVTMRDDRTLTVLNKIKTDGTEYTKVGEPGEAPINMSILGDWIYYGSNFGDVYRIRTDGTDQEQLEEYYMYEHSY